jgi:tetratricopeptide (TPR) repeat protein
VSNLENILSNSDCLQHEALQLYLNKSLDKEQAHHVESHLIDCMFCSDALEGLQLAEAETTSTDLASIKSQIEELIDKEETEKAPLTSTPSQPKPMQVSKRGKRVSWGAIAGLFFLVFGGGLVVFSYINNNTDWFNNNQEHYSKNDKSTSHNTVLEKSKSASPEYGNVTLDTDEIPTAESEKESKTRKKNTETTNPTRKKLDLSSDEKRSDYVARNEPLVEKKLEESIPAPAPSVLGKAAKPKKEARGTSYNLVEGEQSKEIIAKKDVNPDFGNISSQNTYSQPKYGGKLEDVKPIGIPTNKGLSRKKKKSAPSVASTYRSEQKSGDVKIGGGRSDETAYMIDGIQTRGPSKKKASTEEFDSYTVANNAYHKGDYKKSIRYYKKALRQKNLSNRSEVLYQLALAYEKTNSTSKAEKIYEELEANKAYGKAATKSLNRIRKARAKK